MADGCCDTKKEVGETGGIEWKDMEEVLVNMDGRNM